MASMKLRPDIFLAAAIPGLAWFLCCPVQAADRVPANPVMANQQPMVPASDIHTRVYQTVMQYVQSQTQGYPGKVNIEIQPLDSRIRIAECDLMEGFTVQGARLWGKTHVGVRCVQSATKPWTLYVQTDVQVWGDYAVTALPLSQGSPLQSSDVVMQTGDLTKLPAGIITDLSMLEGKKTLLNMPLGTVLRPDLLKSMPVVMQGQTVQLSSRGEGFVITADGTAMQTANVGQVVDVKVSSGQLVKGIAQANGKVDVRF
ncbi:flagella basal body P-ring formation protein FlgA [Methylophilus rhizosphaerae]|uniref:Flagella basal body P-ring formation protein FlgA n=2 Tax=Methylophilus rhizosphaerae TaxID=492660 RepID=A0A1G8ZDS7_9PROT|nr:flagella basal body P-ring formation protein FlgA [Methylophilus rhizosphaerae]